MFAWELRATMKLEVGVQRPARARNAREVWYEVILPLARAWLHEIMVADAGGCQKSLDTHCCGQNLAPWGYVWVYWPTPKKDLLPKLSNYWVGLSKLFEQVLDMVYHTVGKCRAECCPKNSWHLTDPLQHFGMRHWRILVVIVLSQLLSLPCTTTHWSVAPVWVTWGTWGLWVVCIVMSVGLWLVALPNFRSDYGTADDIMPHVWFNNWLPGQVYIWPIVTSCFPVMSCWEK